MERDKKRANEGGEGRKRKGKCENEREKKVK